VTTITGRHILGAVAVAALVSIPFDLMIVNAVVTDIRLEKTLRAIHEREAARDRDRAIADLPTEAPSAHGVTIIHADSEDEAQDSVAGGGVLTARTVGHTEAGATAMSGTSLPESRTLLHALPERRGKRNLGVTAGETALRTLANEIADERRIPRSLLASLVTDESTWRSKVRGKHGEVGLLQLKKETARWCGGTVDREDPEQNLQCGARYLRAQFEAFGSWELAVVAFKAGPRSIPDNIPEASWAYAQRTMRRAGDLR